MRIASRPGEPETATPFVEGSYSTGGPVLDFGPNGSQETNFVVVLEVPARDGFVEFAVQAKGHPRRVIGVPLRIAHESP